LDRPCAVTGNIFTIMAVSIELEKYVLAILNSSLIKYYWQIMFNDFKSSFPQVTIFSLGQIPIPEGNLLFENPFIELVDKILVAKKENSEADTSKWENEIDQLVYKLYDLTPEEIRIVEGGSK
jgi:adenine-specific DNA-methyltransferase